MQERSMFFVAGPCAAESRELVLECAQALKEIFSARGIDWVFKASFDKANRSSGTSPRGLGFDRGLAALAEVKSRCSIPVLTDVHEVWQAAEVAQAVDALQIPALLCRQTDLVAAAARTGRIVNIKKGQFMAPQDMRRVVEKAEAASREAGFGRGKIWTTERGTCFGYNNLVVDMRSLRILNETARRPVLYDAGHSIQAPGALANSSGGERRFLRDLARAAVATGWVHGVYFETHPDPDNALCDGPCMLPLSEVADFVDDLTAIHHTVAGRPSWSSS